MSYAKILFSFSSLSLLLAATSAHADPRKPTHIACVGDSITYGSGSSDPGTKSYPALLQGLVGNAVQVQNFGVSGATMLSTGDKPYTKEQRYTDATTFVDNAGDNAVVSVIIILGANDSKPFNWEPASGKKDAQYKTDYLAMVDHFAQLKTKPTVYVTFPLATTGNNPCCSIRGNIIYDEQIPIIKQVATEKRVPIIDLNTPTTNHAEWQGDGVHPNDAGYVVMADLVKKGLEREPKLSIMAPTEGSMFTFGGMVPLAAKLNSDETVDFKSVEFFEGGASLGKAEAAPFTVMWPAQIGPHTITAKGTDTTLASGTSDPVMFTVIIEGAAGSGSGGAAGAAGSGSAGAPGAGSAPVGTAGMPAAGGMSGSSAGAPSNAATPATEDAGCGCAVPGSSPGGAPAGLALLGVLAWLRRRRAA